MGRIGPVGIPELLIILALVLLIFGPKRLPEMAKGLGQSVREFRKGIRDMKKDFDDDGEGDKPKAAPVSAASVPAPEAHVPASEHSSGQA
ncbi:MAG: twin-arginine translocase TatA/TatE family subunit [Trueperaceae bacterium]|jgi:sec-independent protein translocase protein TatA|nr:twin-arginine translocase TatA/TatE family subunit [Truepera sp.]HRN18176.1 twin-arginine translocase TatA/TatE family subunit [Trueperaceae bacterium]